MSSIRDLLVALDTNQFLFAVRRDAAYSDCETLVYDRLGELRILVPRQVLIELTRNLSQSELDGVLQVVRRAREATFDYEPESVDAIAKWEARGAKKGDAVIAACLERRSVSVFISENRHFLREIADLSFEVLNAEETVRLLQDA